MTRSPIIPLRDGWPIARRAPDSPTALNRDRSEEIDRLIARVHADIANDRRRPKPPLIGVTGVQLAAFVALLMGIACGLGAMIGAAIAMLEGAV